METYTPFLSIDLRVWLQWLSSSGGTEGRACCGGGGQRAGGSSPADPGRSAPDASCVNCSPSSRRQSAKTESLWWQAHLLQTCMHHLQNKLGFWSPCWRQHYDEQERNAGILEPMLTATLWWTGEKCWDFGAHVDGNTMMNRREMLGFWSPCWRQHYDEQERNAGILEPMLTATLWWTGEKCWHCILTGNFSYRSSTWLMAESIKWSKGN